MEQKILKQQNFDRLWKAISPQFCENLGLWELASARPWRGRLGTLFVRPVQALDFPELVAPQPSRLFCTVELANKY